MSKGRECQTIDSEAHSRPAERAEDGSRQATSRTGGQAALHNAGATPSHGIIARVR